MIARKCNSVLDILFHDKFNSVVYIHAGSGQLGFETFSSESNYWRKVLKDAHYGILQFHVFVFWLIEPFS